MRRRQSARIVLADEAEGDLQAIYNQRFAQRGAEGADGADALLESLVASMESLTDFPLRGPIPPELEAIGIADWRQLSVAPYRIIYTVAADQVTIAIIADGRRDFASLLERRLLQRASRA
jgi:plasmid stabilization system protein ParE